jgi:hypothetical protein
MGKLTISIGGREMKLIRSVYADNGNTSLQLVDKETGLPEAMLSLNTKEEMEHGVFFLKDYAENENLSKLVIGSGVIEPVAKYRQVGYRTVQAWKIIDANL